ncbi:MAG TPA: hypothetical protein VE443_06105 [Beijerinckiaceae bacterium]|jgi:hypothetical protein|nr:hypothetical protein [Microvirga sp.]HZB37559.1 hypothetical protein [Beijerinckiaceae bacterium]
MPLRLQGDRVALDVARQIGAPRRHLRRGAHSAIGLAAELGSREPLETFARAGQKLRLQVDFWSFCMTKLLMNSSSTEHP